MATIESSINLPMVGCFSLACRRSQGAPFGTQKMLAARYSPWSSGSVYYVSTVASICMYFVWKVTEICFRKIKPRTTCLYSKASVTPASCPLLPTVGSQIPGSRLCRCLRLFSPSSLTLMWCCSGDTTGDMDKVVYFCNLIVYLYVIVGKFHFVYFPSRCTTVNIFYQSQHQIGEIS